MPNRSERIQRLNEETDEYELPYISKSRVMEWLKNPEHFRFKYLEDIGEPETFPMKRGTAIHETFEHYYEQVQREERYVEPEEPSALPPDRSKWADFLEPHVTNFFSWEHERWQYAQHRPESYVPVGIEEEVWVDDDIPWMGIMDAVLPSRSLSEFHTEDGVVIVDFKTGKVPREQYRDEGIFTELTYYMIVAESSSDFDQDIVGAAAYYPKEDTTLTVTRDSILRQRVKDAVGEMIDAVEHYDGSQKFDINPGPLCKWGTDDDEQSSFYGVCSQCTWGVPANNPETFKTMVKQGYPVPDIAEALGTSTDAVMYWARKMDFDVSWDVQKSIDIEAEKTGYWKHD